MFDHLPVKLPLSQTHFANNLACENGTNSQPKSTLIIRINPIDIPLKCLAVPRSLPDEIDLDLL